MRKFKKLAASVAAITTAISLSAGTLAVTANEIKKDINKTFAEKAFIATFNDAKYKDVAKYLVDNGISLDDAKDIMTLYIEGNKEEKPIKKAERIKSSGNNNPKEPVPFYSVDKVSDKKHYGVIVANRGDVHDDNAFYYLGYEKSDPVVDLQTVSHVNSLNSGVTDMGCNYWDADKYYLSIYANLNMNLPSGNTTCVCDFPVTVTTSYTTEKEIHDKIELKASTGANCNVPVEYYFETYIQGDLDRNGKVDVRDLVELTNYNLNSGRFTNTFTDVDPNVAIAVLKVAGDLDRNGCTELNDIVILKKILKQKK